MYPLSIAYPNTACEKHTKKNTLSITVSILTHIIAQMKSLINLLQSKII